MPSFDQLTALFADQPELPAPLPRHRHSITPAKPLSADPAAGKPLPHHKRQEGSWLWRVFTMVFWTSWKSTGGSSEPRKPNPFMVLKAGNKMTVIAVVDCGSISFFRFGQGVFSEWPMI